jgi:hypothetical protein
MPVQETAKLGGRSPTELTNTEAKSIKVPTIDGGGIRGIIPAVIPAELQKRLSQDM